MTDYIKLKRYPRCCILGPHDCQVCKQEFLCDSSDGKTLGEGTPPEWISNPKMGILACIFCRKYIPSKCKCLTCSSKFNSRNKLFRHLKENPKHIN